MLERERPEAEVVHEATVFLIMSLVSHNRTSGIIGELDRGLSAFRIHFHEAESPLQVLKAVSEFGTPNQVEVVASQVDAWTNNGNKKKMSQVRKLLRGHFRMWSEEVEISRP